MSRSRELKQHILQLQDIRMILNSMKNLAYMETVKLARFLSVQNQVVRHIDTVASDFLAFHAYPELLVDKPEHVYLLIGSERGFCGDFNETLLAEMSLDQHAEVIAVGRKLCLRMEQYSRSARFIDGPNVAEDVPETIIQLINTVGEVQKQHEGLQLTALYHGSETNKIIRHQLLPPFQHPGQDKNSHTHPPVLNMDPEVFLAELIDHYLFAVLHEIFYTSLMAENHSRLQHMDGAVQHLDKQNEKLKRKAQTFRQEEITEEIEVILLTAESWY